MPQKVQLVDFTLDPLSKLYAAYRTCYSSETPHEIWEKIRSNSISKDKIEKFIVERMATGHNSPLEQVVLWFAISGVSRSLSHQLVRHRIGISFAQQSQRYVKYDGSPIRFVVPKTWAPLEKEYRELMEQITKLYSRAVKNGIPAEDARFVLPNATPTNFWICVNFAELLHICDLRLCTRAQWEIRRMVALMRAEVKRSMPELAKYLQPKCGEHRTGFCDESLRDYENCPIGKKRPHKSIIVGAPLEDGDLK
jgi:thymidylate synthase (FAD)